MFGEGNIRNKIITSALKLAETKSWSDISWKDISEEANVSLGELYENFGRKKDILIAFSTAVDAAVISTVQQGSANAVNLEESARDRLFDVLMTRLEVLSPYRNALKRIFSDFRKGYGLQNLSLDHLWGSNRWMLTAAGISDAGREGKIVVMALTAVYLRVIPVWLEDEDPGLGKTMAALDKSLRNGEKWMQKVGGVISQGEKMLEAFSICLKGKKNKSGVTEPSGGNQMEDVAREPSKI